MNKCSKAGALYSIECTSENAGIPYADYFSVQAHYCLARRGERAALALYGHVKYKKTMWPLVKVSPLSPVAAASVALPTTTVLSPRLPAAQPSRATTWLALVLVLLLAVNAVLYWKLYHTDHTRNMDLNHLHTSFIRYELRFFIRIKLLAWRDALDRTVAHLVQTEQALTKLLETIKPALEKAEQEAEPRDDL
ncbi:jg10633 [Pararge aegeria aegeria]|uniref:Jg10633 protein n=1 Tax=Pararge aegeria aegeria TaxID=348720 RepID=A0A8S4RC35_9NEOP|nr:jg10633 [Pararge aegeria aegeria]